MKWESQILQIDIIFERKSNSNPRSNWMQIEQENYKTHRFILSCLNHWDYGRFLVNHQVSLSYQRYKYSSLTLLDLTKQAWHQAWTTRYSLCYQTTSSSKQNQKICCLFGSLTSSLLSYRRIYNLNT